MSEWLFVYFDMLSATQALVETGRVTSARFVTVLLALYVDLQITGDLDTFVDRGRCLVTVPELRALTPVMGELYSNAVRRLFCFYLSARNFEEELSVPCRREHALEEVGWMDML